MGRFSAAKMFFALDLKFQKMYNNLIDLLDSGYIVSGKIGDKDIAVEMSSKKPFEMSINGVKQIYVNTNGVLITSIYDVNEDGIVDQEDIDLVQNYILTGTGYLPRMDVNQDGSVNAIDLTLISRAANKDAWYLQFNDYRANFDQNGFYVSKDAGTSKTYVGIKHGTAWAKYSFVDDGGDVSTIVPLDAFNLTIPDNAIVVASTINVISAVTSGGLATVAIGLTGTVGSTTAVLAATPKVSLGTGVLLNGVRTFATPLKLTSPSKMSFTIGAAALTAGVIEVFLQYYVAEN